jgi:hypothetical protein
MLTPTESWRNNGELGSCWPWCRFEEGQVNLSDMIHFMTYQLGFVLTQLQELETSAASEDRDARISDALIEHRIIRLLQFARKRCEELEMPSAVARIERFLVACRMDCTNSELATQAKVLRETIDAELRFRRFAYVPMDRAKHLDNIEKDWAIVLRQFPSARDDIRAAVECYALDCTTACVFHSMRIAEHGLRALAQKLKVRRIGPQKHPLEFAEWGGILSALRGKLASIQQSKGRNAKKAAGAKFYADAASHADYLNEIWRKEVSHARGLFNAAEALNALTRTRAFMELLSGKISEASPGA